MTNTIALHPSNYYTPQRPTFGRYPLFHILREQLSGIYVSLAVNMPENV